MIQFVLQDSPEMQVLAFLVVEQIVVEEVVLVTLRRKLKFQRQISTLHLRTPSSTSRTWSRKQLLDHHLERTHQVLLPQRQKYLLLVTISQHHSLTTSPRRVRIVWRLAVPGLEDENGVGKSKRRTLRHSGRVVSITAIVVDFVDGVVVVEDIEGEAIVEMANQGVDVVAIEAVEMHKPLCNNSPGLITPSPR